MGAFILSNGIFQKKPNGVEDVKQNCENYENFQVSVKKEVKLPEEIKKKSCGIFMGLSSWSWNFQVV